MFSYRDGVEISVGHERRLSLRDFVKFNEQRNGVVIVPVHTRRTLKRLHVRDRKRSMMVTAAGGSSRMARKMNEAKNLDIISGGWEDTLSPGKEDAGGLFPEVPVTGGGKLGGEEVDDSLEMREESAMEMYEDIKERIAVSYLADVERQRIAARSALHRIMEESALKIQSMFRCLKAKSYVEDVLLQLQAAAVLQGIVRRDQSKAIVAKKKMEEKEKMLKSNFGEINGKMTMKRQMLAKKEPKRRERPVFSEGRKLQVASDGPARSISAIVSIYVSRVGLNENCYRVKISDVRSGVMQECEIELTGEGYTGVQTGLDKQSDNEFFGKVCDKLVLLKEADDKNGAKEAIIFDHDNFYKAQKISSTAIRVGKRREKYLIDVTQLRGRVSVKSTNMSSGESNSVVVSPRHWEKIEGEIRVEGGGKKEGRDEVGRLFCFLFFFVCFSVAPRVCLPSMHAPRLTQVLATASSGSDTGG